MMHIDEARKREPRLTGQDGSEVLWSPNTAVVDIQACLRKTHELTQQENPNYEVFFGEEYSSH